MSTESALLSLMAASMGLAGLIATGVAMRKIGEVRARCHELEASLAVVRREIELMTSISVKTGRRVRKIEHECSGVSDRVDQVEQRAPTPSFDRAIESARRGADPGSLTSRYGLSRGEAELVARLHGNKKIA